MPFKQDWDKLVENFKKVAKDPGLLKSVLAEAKVTEQEKIIDKALVACDKCHNDLGKSVDVKKVDSFRKAIEPFAKAKKSYASALTDEIEKIKKGQKKQAYADFYRGLKVLKTGIDAIEANIDNIYDSYFGILEKNRGVEQSTDALRRATGKSLKSALAKALASIQNLKSDLTPANYNKINGANITAPGRIVHAQLSVVRLAIGKGVQAPAPTQLLESLHPYAVTGELKCEIKPTNNPETDRQTVAKNIKEISGLVKLVATTYAELLKE